MNRKIAAVLLAATMMTTPAFAVGVTNSPNTPTAPHKITRMSVKGVSKHQDHARASYGHKVHRAKLRAVPNQVKHATRSSKKKGMVSTSPKSNTKTAAAVHVKAPVRN
jgi:predicted ABC-class ATPase